ncbi:P-type DNA transfer ATPase VirB11 [Metapseudomonas otitidis]|uniref:P-type DNA transfer ATPase VirB11 n=1 Tax=Metapseudomonas otitidis TaxID=319939 RepID=UPI000D19F3B9|nr:P-type DNA transfer ATPase VirB11 [Pseudomonas otitidis]
MTTVAAAYLVPTRQIENRLKLLDKFLAPSVNEIWINRPGQLITEGRDGRVVHDTPELDQKYLEGFVSLVAAHNGKVVDNDSPIMSGRLPGGQRIQIVIPPACLPGTLSITIRVPQTQNFTLAELEAQGAFDLVADARRHELDPVDEKLLALKSNGRISEFLDLAVKSHRNILIAGKTGSGKTTVAQSLIDCIPPDERLVTIEDAHELTCSNHVNKVHLLYSAEGHKGSVSAKQALKSCLRMKPDRILLAEMRGDEAWDYIKSMNTGHPGSIGTLHCNGAAEAFEQITSFVKDSPVGAHLETAFIKERLYSTIDIVLFYEHRKLREIYFDPQYKRQQLG